MPRCESDTNEWGCGARGMPINASISGRLAIADHYVDAISNLPVQQGSGNFDSAGPPRRDAM
jgi:hypothetical protein